MIKRTFRVIPAMSKSKKSGKGKEVEAVASNSGPIALDKSGNISIKVLAKPGSKYNGVTDVSEEGVGVQIAAPPVEGEANTELVKYLSKLLGLRKSDVSLDRGSKSRHKTILISKGVTTVEKVSELLQKESTAS